MSPPSSVLPSFERHQFFEEWLDKCPNPSWKVIIEALERAGEMHLAQRVSETLSEEVLIEGEAVKKLSELHKKFGSLSFDCKRDLIALVRKKKVTLEDLVLRTNEERSYNLDKLCHTHVETIDQFFQAISPHYHFLDCHLLVVLVEQFLNPSQQMDKLQNHVQNVEKFKCHTQIRYLQKTLTPFTMKSPQEIPVTIRVENAWGRHDLWLVETLLQTMFSIESKTISKWFRVIPGSLTIVFLIPHHMSVLFIEHSKHKIEFMKLIGVVSLQIGDTYILQDKGNNYYTFEQGLIQATKRGNYEAVKFLLQYTCVDYDAQTNYTGNLMRADYYTSDLSNNFNFTCEKGTTALVIACCHGDTGIVQLLLESNANPNLQTYSGWTSLMYATLLGMSKIVKMLLQSKADVNMREFRKGGTALMHACMLGNEKIVKTLLNHSADPNVQRNDGATPLHIATQNGHLPIVQQLLQEKVDPNISMKDGRTPLYIASQNGHLPVVDQLLLQKADPNIPLNYGATPLWIASQSGHLPVVERLLQEKVDPNISTKDGRTPLYVASQNGHLPVAVQLLLHKADPNISTNDGRTPLYIASQNGHLPVIDQLLLQKADPTIPLNYGATPLWIAGP